MTALSDKEARARAISDLDASMTLNAGAGSGKTSVLTERIVTLFESGAVAPASLAAITFTEKAAGELLSRVRDRLEARLAEANTREDAERVAILTAVLDRFGEITLATIHSFCRDILRREALESAFAPDTEIGDEGTDDERASEAVREWLTGLRMRRPALWRILGELASFGQLRTAAKSLARYRQHQDILCKDPLDPIAARSELRALQRAIADAARSCARPDEDKLIAANRPLVEAIARANETPDPQDGMLDLLLGSAKPYRRGGKAKDWGGDEQRQAYLEALDGITVWRAHCCERAHGDVVRELRTNLVPRLDEARLDASVAGFDDLLADAARVLRQSRAARERLACRYRVVLIDEIQDTDPVQAEVALLLTRALDEVGPWHGRPPEPGRLFAVGDPKQSIYRFRGADVTTFSRIEAVVGEENRSFLSQNFRSVPGLCAWFNHVFAGLPGYEPQTPHRRPGRIDRRSTTSATSSGSGTATRTTSCSARERSPAVFRTSPQGPRACSAGAPRPRQRRPGCTCGSTWW
jgi:ATP-dependent helicase/nuclease subunit A